MPLRELKLRLQFGNLVFHGVHHKTKHSITAAANSRPEHFVHDVENASAQIHVLTPARYEAPSRAPYSSQDATEVDERLAHAHGDGHVTEMDSTWKKTHAAMFEALRMLGRSRMQG